MRTTDFVRRARTRAQLLVLPRLAGWAAQWDRLVDGAPLPSPFLRSWWLTSTAGPRSVFLLVVQQQELLGGVALDRGYRLGLPCVRMTGAGRLCPDHLDLITQPGHEEIVLSAIGAWLHRPGTRLVDLDGMRPDSAIAAALPGPVRTERRASAPWTFLPADPAVYVAACPPGLRRKLRRASARLAAEGARHRVYRGASVPRSLDTLRRLHARQWGERSRFLPDFPQLAAACHRGADVDEVAVHEISTPAVVAATMVTFEVAGRVSLYQSARLTDYRWRDAATVLLGAIISDACSRGFAEVDFLRGEEDYKDSFAPERRQLVRLQAANNAVGQAALAVEFAARAIRRELRR